MNINPILQTALNLAKLGIPVLPCKPDKRPLTANGVHSASTDRDAIILWWSTTPNAMLGLAMGSSSGVVVVDCDTHNGKNGVANFQKLCEDNAYTPHTKSERTPSGGIHYYYRLNKNECPKSKIGFLDGVDFLSNDRYVISAPSVAQSGKYELVNDVAIEPLPDWLLEIVTTEKAYSKPDKPDKPVIPVQPFRCTTPYSNTVLQNACKRIASSTDGMRNDTLYKEACSVFSFVAGGELEEYEAYEKLLQAANKCGLVHEDLNQVKATLQSARVAGFAAPRMSPSNSNEGHSFLPSVPSNNTLAPVVPQDNEQHIFLPPTIDLSLFKPSFQKLIKETSSSFGVPTTIAIADLLALGSCLVGRNKLLLLRKGWYESGVLWILIVADSAVGKTHITNYYFNNLSDIEHSMNTKWREDNNEYVLAKRKYDKQALKDDVTELEEPIRPRRIVFTIDDATPESLPRNLEDNPKGILWRTDEAATLILGFDKYSSTGITGSTKGRLLSAYDSSEWKTDRVSDDKNYFIRHASVGILTSIQSKELPRIFNSSDENSGFLPRFLIFWAGLEQPILWDNDNTVSYESENLLSDIVDTMTMYTMQEDASGEPQPEIVRLEPDAQKLWANWYDYKNNLVFYYANNKNDRFASSKVVVLKKAISQAARICLVIHCLEQAAERIKKVSDISADTLERSLKLVDAIIKHSLSTYSYFHANGNLNMTTNTNYVLMQVIAENKNTILANDGVTAISTLRDLYRTKMNLTEKELSDKAFGTLLKGFQFKEKFVGTKDKRQRAVYIPLETITEFERQLTTQANDDGTLLDAFWNEKDIGKEIKQEMPDNVMSISGMEKDNLVLENQKICALQIISDREIAMGDIVETDIPSDDFTL